MLSLIPKPGLIADHAKRMIGRAEICAMWPERMTESF
jgi:hypothetical protein